MDEATTTTSAPAARPKLRRGFACMTSEQRAAIASKGGRSAHAAGTAHEFSSDEARRAGRKGGKAVARDRDHMARIGKKGGAARRAPRAPAGTEGGTNA